MILKRLMAALITVWATCAVAWSEDLNGPFLTLEGDIAGHVGHMTEGGNYTLGDPADPWSVGGAPLTNVFGGRIEAGWEHRRPQDQGFRFGLIYSNWGGSSNLSGNATAIVFGQPSPDGQKPQWEIAINDQPNAGHVSFEAHQSYWELMPDFQFMPARYQAEGLRFGLQPFYGEFGNRSSSDYLHPFGVNLVAQSTTNSALSGSAFGALFTLGRDFHPSKSVRLFIDGGLGAYSASATGSIEGVQDGVLLNRQSTIQGLRAQLALGTEYDVNSHVSFGTVARFDLWSAFPGISGKYGDWGGQDECFRKPNGDLVCSPPKIIGAYDILGAPMANLFIGASLTLRP